MIWGGRCGLTKTKQKSPTTLVSRPVGVRGVLVSLGERGFEAVRWDRPVLTVYSTITPMVESVLGGAGRAIREELLSHRD